MEAVKESDAEEEKKEVTEDGVIVNEIADTGEEERLKAELEAAKNMDINEELFDDEDIDDLDLDDVWSAI